MKYTIDVKYNFLFNMIGTRILVNDKMNFNYFFYYSTIEGLASKKVFITNSLSFLDFFIGK